MSWIARGWWVAMLAIACGPKVDVGADGGTTGGTGTTTSAEVTTGVYTTSAGPGTTVTSVDSGWTEVTTFDTWASSGASDDTMFIDRPDGGGGWSDCDLFAQDCPRGEKCMPWANDGGLQWNAMKCVPVDPYMAGIDDPCWVEGGPVSGIDNCDATSMCFAVHPKTELGTCVAFCQGSWQMPVCEDPSTTCLITNEGVISLCLPACDPLLQECPDAQGCYPGDDLGEFVCTPDFSGDGGGDGDVCTGPGPWFCDAGLACVASELLVACAAGPFDAGCCSPWCDAFAPSEGQCDTAAGEACVPWIPPGKGPPQLDPVGVCRLPD